MSAGELRRFAERFGSRALFDTESKLYRDAGLAYLSMDDDAAFERLLADQRLLLVPLIRVDANLTVGFVEPLWAAWVKAHAQGRRR
jgi:arsenate reductase-like glutaredoxin family protein